MFNSCHVTNGIFSHNYVLIWTTDANPTSNFHAKINLVNKFAYEFPLLSLVIFLNFNIECLVYTIFLLLLALKHEPDGRVILAEFENFRLLATYSPNNGWKEEENSFQRRRKWDNRMLEFVTKHSEKPLIWCGDLNVRWVSLFLPFDGTRVGSSFSPRARSFLNSVEISKCCTNLSQNLPLNFHCSPKVAIFNWPP